MGAAVAEMIKVSVEDPLLKTLEQALSIAERDVHAAEQQLWQKAQRRDAVKTQIESLRRELDLPLTPDQAPSHDGSLTQGIRDALGEVAEQGTTPLERTMTVKEIEHIVWQRGYRSGASRFYWAVNGTLRAMADVVVLMKEGETSRFGLREALSRAPSGWKLVENPRRTTSASRKSATTEDKAKGRGR